jgi:hypothetical protein
MSTHDQPSATAPVRVNATLEPELSRWLWLVKWLLVIPHLIVLFFLWVAFVILTIIAFFAIAFTGRYPRRIFDFNLGVLRWAWRVGFYSYAALGTDRYPPFSLGEEAGYPARLDIAYPERLSRGLLWVKSWLLAIPHLLLVAVFFGGGFTLSDTDRDGGSLALGLVALLVLIAAFGLLFTGAYITSIFDFVMGLDRWGLRVAAYVSLMTDDYPPFRLDMGGADPSTPGEAPRAP